MQAATEAAIHGEKFTIKIYKTPSKRWCPYITQIRVSAVLP